jgi:hypothetical protein
MGCTLTKSKSYTWGMPRCGRCRNWRGRASNEHTTTPGQQRTAPYLFRPSERRLRVPRRPVDDQRLARRRHRGVDSLAVHAAIGVVVARAAARTASASRKEGDTAPPGAHMTFDGEFMSQRALML